MREPNHSIDNFVLRKKLCIFALCVLVILKRIGPIRGIALKCQFKILDE